ncbi:MAG: Dipeptidyl aminopeptidase 4 [Bacteroidia bacterium]|nr:MAG: Dipeptidyl aminopeptidase 4 [Bacteroidia bacterium]
MKNTFILILLAYSTLLFGQKRNIELSDIWASGTFYPKTVNGFVNLNDGKSYCVLEKNDEGFDAINQYDYVSGSKIKEILNAKDVFGDEKYGINSYAFNQDQTVVLIYFNSQKIYRHSTRGDFKVVQLTDKQVIGGGKEVRYPTLNPKGTKLAYVKENDLYVMDLMSQKVKRITKDGEYNTIINGAVDWVYEEEFGMSKGFEWNSDGTRIAFYRFDESAVKQWQMTTYGKLYPDLYKFKYPKAGESNSIVQVFIADAQKGGCKLIALNSDADQYIPRIKWTKNPNVLSVQRLNRLQNKWNLLMVEGTNVQVSLEETNPRYVDITDDLFFLSDKKHMIVSSERDGYKHLYFHKVDGPQIFQITSGDWEVDQVLGIDEKNELIYYTSTEVNPTERHIYSIDFQGKKKLRLTTESGWHSAQFSTDFTLALHNYHTATQPHVFNIKDKNWETQRVVEDNEDFKVRNNQFIMGDISFDQLSVNDNDLNYWMIKPASFNDSTKYPLLIYVYGGPGSQTVKNSFGWSNYYWYQMLANKYNIIIASVDNRGTGARGADFKKMTYRQLGKYETEDQIAAAKSLGQLSFIDKNRLGIWGWSYGGYMSSLALAKGNDVFKMAIAVAPVTNWRYYDNIYTERYMGLPQDNGAGYDDNSPINFVRDIKGKYLIVHGTGDDNVHFQNSVMMVNELIKNNIPFDSEFYPNKNHSIYGGATRYHLYNKMTNFILENL